MRGPLLLTTFVIATFGLTVGIKAARYANAGAKITANPISAVGANSVRDGALVLTVPRGMRRYVFRHDHRVVNVVVANFLWKWRYPERPGSMHPLPEDGGEVWLNLTSVRRGSLFPGIKRVRLPLSLDQPWSR